MVDYIIELGDRFKQTNLTIHIAVSFLDRALATHADILLNRLNVEQEDIEKEDHSWLWAVVSLMLASKYDEIDMKIPFYKEFRKASTRASKFDVEEFHFVEEYFIKDVLKWNLHTLTPLHFVHCLTSQGILFEDDEYPDDLQKTLKSLNKKSELFTDLSLDSEYLTTTDYSKSLVGVAWIVWARKICGIKPLWNNKLYNLTSYHFFDINDIIEILLKDYCAFFGEDYSQIMSMLDSKKSRQQRPQSFVGRRKSEKPKLQTQLAHIQSAKSLHVGQEQTTRYSCTKMSSGQVHTDYFDCQPSDRQNFEMRSIKLEACDGDTFSTSLSIPEEIDSEGDIFNEFQMVSEKWQTRCGTNSSQESEAVKISLPAFRERAKLTDLMIGENKQAAVVVKPFEGLKNSKKLFVKARAYKSIDRSTKVKKVRIQGLGYHFTK